MMTISNRIFLLILITTSLSTLANFILTQHQSMSLHHDSEKILARTLVRSLRDALIQDVINDNQLRITNLLKSLKSHDNPIEYLYITKGIHNTVFAHSFEKGIPRFLVHSNNPAIKQSGVHLVHKYQTEHGLIYDYSETLLTGLDASLHIGINQTKIIEQLKKNNQYILTISIIILLSALLIAFLLGRQVSKPLTQFVHQIKLYGQGNIIKLNKLKNTSPEIKQLTTAFQCAIVERQQAESSLKSSEARLRGLLNTLPDLVWLKDKNGIFLSCNAKFGTFYGAKEVNIIGKTDYDFVSKDIADVFRKNDKAAEALGQPRTNEEQLTYASDGHKEWVETIKAPMYELNGDYIGVLGI
ncbi:MAG: PAS domain S-box protein [gamma proteobacterium symbiont of Taylorina sp.]|nr:PAS domain S-box protein [gamma proteobacterium symbiont of Taylorina sp.]